MFEPYVEHSKVEPGPSTKKLNFPNKLSFWNMPKRIKIRQLVGSGLLLLADVASTKSTSTPWKTNIEPENHPFEKENHLLNLHFGVPFFWLIHAKQPGSGPDGAGTYAGTVGSVHGCGAVPSSPQRPPGAWHAKGWFHFHA